MSETLIGIIAVFTFILVLLLSRNYLLSIFIFAAVGLCLHTHSFVNGMLALFETDIYAQMLDPAKAAVIGFIALYCGYVGSMEYGGPIKGFTKFIADHGKANRLSVQVSAWFASVGAFFSDLGSPAIVGNLFRPKYDAQGISRESLALMINLTAVPVCSMIPIVGWGLFAIGVINNTVSVSGITVLPIEIFLRSIPYFCLPILAAVTPLLLTNHKFEIGPIRLLNREAKETKAVYQSDRAKYVTSSDIAEEDGRSITLLSSLTVIFIVLFTFLKAQDQRLPSVQLQPFMLALSVAFVIAALFAMLLTRLTEKRPLMKRSFSLYMGMFKRTLSVTGIMVMAWVFFDVAYRLGIYQVACSYCTKHFPTFVLLPLVLTIAAGLSHYTGSAWGTYAVVMPFSILLCDAVGLPVWAGVGAAVSGSVFGDISARNSHAMHFSAESSGVDAEGLSKVQMPYLRNILISCVIAYAIGASASVWYGCILPALLSYLLITLIEHSVETRNVGGKQL